MIYITGDTHGELNLKKISNKNFPPLKELTMNDYVIVLGDFGLIWKEDDTFKYWLEWLEKKNFNILFIDGNHENFNLLKQYPVENWNGGKIHKISNNIFHLMRGQVFTIDGFKIFTFGGASSVDKEYRIDNIDWWEEELPSYEEINEGLLNLEKHNFNVDFILTHTCSANTISDILSIDNSSLEQLSFDTRKEILKLKKYGISDLDVLNNLFSEIQNKTKYNHWYFGHFHIDAQLSKKDTAVYNDFILLKRE